jgi:hypothetical protein
MPSTLLCSSLKTKQYKIYVNFITDRKSSISFYKPNESACKDLDATTDNRAAFKGVDVFGMDKMILELIHLSCTITCLGARAVAVDARAFILALAVHATSATVSDAAALIRQQVLCRETPSHIIP